MFGLREVEQKDTPVVPIDKGFEKAFHATIIASLNLVDASPS